MIGLTLFFWSPGVFAAGGFPYGFLNWLFAINFKMDDEYGIRLRVCGIELGIIYQSMRDTIDADSVLKDKEKARNQADLLRFLQKKGVKLVISDEKKVNLMEKSFVLPSETGLAPNDLVGLGDEQGCEIVTATGFRELGDGTRVHYYR